MSTAAARADGAEGRAREAPASRGSFADALARAKAARETGRTDAATPKGRDPGLASPAQARRKAGPVHETPSDMRPADLPPGAAQAPGIPGSSAASSEIAGLRAAVRAVPAAIAAASIGAGGAQLAISFGNALSLDLRSGARGLELTLRPAPGLERATRAELPGLVEALRARGIRVVRADVGPRALAAPGGVHAR